MKKFIFVVLVAGVFLSGCSEKESENKLTKIETKEVVKVEDKNITAKVEDVQKKLDKEPEIKKEEPVKVTEEPKVDENKTVEPKKVETIIEVKDTKTTEADTAKGKIVFDKKCKSCHGITAQNRALGKSKIIKGWEASKTVEAMKGYADGSYGGSMKGIMKMTAKTLSDQKTAEVAKYISTL